MIGYDDNRLPSQRGGEERCCGKCRRHRKNRSGRGYGWQCMNDESDLYLDITDYRCRCVDFEERE